MAQNLAGSATTIARAVVDGRRASCSGLSVKTIRFSCDEALIHPKGRSEAGDRLFDNDVFAELTLIRTLKAMEVSLQEVMQILASRRSGICTCSSLQATRRAKAGEFRQKISVLPSLYTDLNELFNHREDCGVTKVTIQCP